MDEHTVLNRPWPNDGFVASIGRAIREYAQSTHASNPDAPGAERSLLASDQLAAHIDGLPLWDSRFRLLLQVAGDSDLFTFTGNGPRVIQLLGLDYPAPPDMDANLTEFVVESASDLTTQDAGEARVAAVREEFQAERTSAHERIAQLEAEKAELEQKIRDDSQELSDIRGRLQRLDGGQVETRSRRVTALEGELDQANRRAAAAERKKTRAAKKPKVAA